MAYTGACRRARKRGAACIAEQVQDPDGPLRRRDEPRIGVPVHSLLRKYTRMLEACRRHHHADISIGDLPFFRHPAPVFPLSAARSGTVIHRIRAFPQRAAFSGFPDDLRVRPHQDGFAPALQTIAVRCVDELIIFPVVRCPHKNLRSNSAARPGAACAGHARRSFYC